jgi:hypothetical protein
VSNKDNEIVVKLKVAIGVDGDGVVIMTRRLLRFLQRQSS